MCGAVRSAAEGAVRRRSTSSGGCFDVDHKRLKIEELDSIAARPTFWDDQKKAQTLLRDKKQLEQIVGGWDAQVRAISDAEVLLELAEEASDEDSAKEAAGQVGGDPASALDEHRVQAHAVGRARSAAARSSRSPRAPAASTPATGRRC